MHCVYREQWQLQNTIVIYCKKFHQICELCMHSCYQKLTCRTCTQLYSIIQNAIFTARKRSLRRLCFYRCLSVHRGACMVALGSGGCVVALGGHVWLLLGGGHVWQRVACMVKGEHAWQRGGMHGERGA